MKPLDPQARRAVMLLYLGAAVVLFEELFEIFALSYPLHPGVASWRLGLMGITVSKLAAFAIADAMILGAAVLLGHSLVLRVAGVLHLLLAVLVLPAVVSYTLDWITLRRAIKPEFVGGFDLNAVRTVLMSLFAFVVGILVFRATALRTRSQRSASRRREVLIGGQSASGPE